MPVIFDQPFQILLNLARDKKIDPWDVDIDKLAGLYMDRIREMEELDLRVSGRAYILGIGTTANESEYTSR